MSSVNPTMLEPVQKICPQCHKPFRQTCSAREWGYAYGTTLVCSYHCMRAMAKEGEKKEKRIRTLVASSAGAMFLRQHLLGKSYAEIAQSKSAAAKGLYTARAVNSYINNWENRHPDEAEQIRREAAQMTDMATRKQICTRYGITAAALIRACDKLGIRGLRVTNNYLYTAAEVEKIAGFYGRAVS